jgi:hypothetical protein
LEVGLRFEYLRECECGGGDYSFTASGDAPFDSGACDKCGRFAHLVDPLSVSVVAERILRRSKSELDRGDNTLTILLAAIAVETFLTRLFMKLKGMEQFGSGFEWPTPAEEAKWESEYPRNGGFPGPANFVSKRLVQKTFDDFVSSHETANAIHKTLPNSGQLSLSELCQSNLFAIRNRIAHWGYVNSSGEDAQRCYGISVAVVCVLREMDKCVTVSRSASFC